MNTFTIVKRTTMLVFFICIVGIASAQNPDALYPIPSNKGTEIIGDINLFTGALNKEVIFYEINGIDLKYTLKGFYNSASANVINQDKNKYIANVLGGYGWKLMDYPKIVQDRIGYFLVDGESSYKLQLLDDGIYAVGGDKYLWRVSVKNNLWRVSDGNGKHYNFRTAAVTKAGVSVWNYTAMVNYKSTDSISLDYDGNGNIARIMNTSGDTVNLAYINSTKNSAPLLTTLVHKKSGHQIATIAFNYKSYNFSGYEILSEIVHYHQVSGPHYSLMQASTKFNYLVTGGIPPLGGDNYPGALCTEETPSGSIFTYSYQAVNTSGVSGYRVVQYAVNDGYDNNSGGIYDPNTYYAISYTDNNVLADSNKVYLQYNQVYVSPGSRYKNKLMQPEKIQKGKKRKKKESQKIETATASVSAGDTPFGNVEYYFLNGQPTSSLIDLPANYPNSSITSSTLQGQLYQKNINSDTSVLNPNNETVNIANYWDVGRVTSRNLAFPKLLKTYDKKYGVAKWLTYTYGTKYQLPVSISTSRRNPEPNSPLVNRDSLITRITYAFQTYPSLASNSIYLINRTSQTVNLVQNDMQGPFVIAACNCSQWTQWGTSGLPGTSGYWAPVRYLQMRSSSADTTTCITTTSTSNDWLVLGTVNLRAVLGSVIDSTNVMNSSFSEIVSQPSYGEVTVARFNLARTNTINTSLNANADYMGFEEYERAFNTSWKVTDGVDNTAYAHTGDHSFSGTLSRTFSAVTAGGFYIVNVWVGMRQAGDAYSVQLLNAGGSVISSSSGTWQTGDHMLNFIEISGYVPPGQNFSVNLTTQGTGFIDDVVVMPALSAFEGNVYAIERDIKEAVLGVSGATTHLVHNRFNSLIATVGPGSIQNINDLQIPYNSRLGNSFFNNKDTFDTTYPNMKLHASARSGGNWQGFQYSNNNSFPPQNLVGMTIQDNWMIATAANATATFNHSVDTANLALYMEIFPHELGSSSEIGLSMMLDSLDSNGNVVSSKELKFVVTGNSIKLYSGSTVYESIPVSTVLNSTSMLFSISAYNYFHGYVEGRYVFEHEFISSAIRGPAKLITNSVGSAFDNFIFVATPTVYQETFDALMRPKQHLTRQNKDEIKISEMLYGGPLNLPLAETRTAVIGGNDSTGLSYKPDFADGFNDVNMTIDSTSTLGEASYYKSPFNTSASYSKNPMLQLESMGGGGQFTVGQKGNHYNTFSYGEDAGQIFNYTADQLLVTTRKEPNGVKTFTFANRDEVTFAVAMIKGIDTMKTQYEYDTQMRLYRTYHPNYYNKSIPDRQRYILEYTYDFVGNMLSMKTPDAGTTYYVYDPGGNIRFSMDSAGQSVSQNQIVCYKYDGLNRMVEQGVLAINWDRASLQNYADTNPGFPSAGSENYTWRKRFTYDGQGLNFEQGKLVNVMANWDTRDDAEVTETYKYNEYGNVVEKGLVVADFGGGPRVVQYAYDLENRMTQISFPNTEHPGIRYTYNGNNQVVGVGTPSDYDYYAAYDYGYETIEYLNNRSFIRTYGFNNAGWPTEINDQIWGELLTYEHNNVDSTFDYNGKIAGLFNTMKWSGDSVTASFTYDNSARLLQADYGTTNPWSIGISSPVHYDNNGNILNIQYGANTPVVYSYVPGSNKINMISSTQISYNGNGSVTGIQGGVSSLTYDPVSLLTLSAGFRGNEVTYQYDGQDNRVLKQVRYASRKNAKRMYVHGLNDYPLMEVFQDSTGTTYTSFYIYGPKGLIAIQQNTQRLFVLKDHLGSVRAVIDTTNTMRAYFNYGAFGNTMSSFIDPSIAGFSLHYLFTGQEIEPELNGIYNFRARLYDPVIARFYSVDPSMQYPSPYEYAGNNPINYSDPTGKWSWFSTIVTAAVAVVTTAAVIVAAPVILPAAGALAIAAAATAAGTVVGTIAGTASGVFHDKDSFLSSLGNAAAISLVASAATAGSALLGGAIPQGGGYAAVAAQDAGYLSRIGFAVRSGWPTRAGVSFLRSIAAGALSGIGAGSFFQSDPTPIVATNDGITCCEVITSRSLGITGRQIQGGFGATVDLTKAAVYVNDDAFPCNRKYCDGDSFPDPPYDPSDSTYNYMLYSQRIIKAKSSNAWKYSYPSWSETSQQTLYINGGFFYPYVDSYIESCTSNQGIWVAGNKVINSTKQNGFWAFKGESNKRYYLDAIIFYKNPQQNGGKYVDIIPYDEQKFYQSTFLKDNVDNGIGGVYFMRNGQDYSSQLPPGVLAKEENFARMALGITANRKTLYILQISNDYAVAQDGITFSEAVPWFKSKGCTDAIMLDGSASSQLFYSFNGRTFLSRPMEVMAPGQKGYCKQNGITSQQFRPLMQFMGFKKK